MHKYKKCIVNVQLNYFETAILFLKNITFPNVLSDNRNL